MSNLSLSQNAFTQTPTIGMLTFDPQPDTLPCQLNPSSSAPAASFVAGAAVKLVAWAGTGQIIVDATLSASDGPVFGVIEFSKQKNKYVVGDQVNIAARGNILHLKSAGAITRGQNVSVTNPSVTTNDPTVANDTTQGDYILGVALGQAAGAGELIRIQVSPGLLGAAGVITVTP